ncbi:unnamed protein product [Blepharisma stoltei]|uniref:Uncharacterized protein n=1 Tax=Blepharisma stoltei TaxID=1481888 RepID=A0AAU9IJW9_9CILI|nr:unnamed protein product [Blepharisma stoltei]
MGFISAFLCVFVPLVSFSTYITFRQGNKLPQITRQTGRSIGMGYNYLRIVIKHMTPKSNESIEVIRKMRQVGQQAFAFSNEVKWNLLETKPLIKEAFPNLTEDPFNKFGLRGEIKGEEEKKPNPAASTSNLIAETFNQRSQLIKKKKQKALEEETSNRI